MSKYFLTCNTFVNVYSRIFEGYFDKKTKKIKIKYRQDGYVYFPIGNAPAECSQYPTFNWKCKNQCVNLTSTEKSIIGKRVYDILYGHISRYAQSISTWYPASCLEQIPYFYFSVRETALPITVRRVMGKGSWPRSTPSFNYKPISPPVCFATHCQPPRHDITVHLPLNGNSMIEVWPPLSSYPCKKK